MATLNLFEIAQLQADVALARPTDTAAESSVAVAAHQMPRALVPLGTLGARSSTSTARVQAASALPAARPAGPREQPRDATTDTAATQPPMHPVSELFRAGMAAELRAASCHAPNKATPAHRRLAGLPRAHAVGAGTDGGAVGTRS